MNETMKKLQWLSGSYKVAVMASAAVELGAVALMFAVNRGAGLALGIAAMIAYFAVTRLCRRRYSDLCAKTQTLHGLPLENMTYKNRDCQMVDTMKACGLLPQVLEVDMPLCLNAVTGTYQGIPVEMAEATFGCIGENQKKRVFNSGVALRLPLRQAVETPVMLIGNRPFHHTVTRKSYEADGWKMAPVGGKAKGWYAFTPQGTTPDKDLLDRWDTLCTKLEGKVIVSLREKELCAFFVSSFYTDRYAINEPVDEAELKKCLFPYLPLVKALAD